VERRIKRPLRDAELASAALSQPLPDLIAVGRCLAEDGEQQTVEVSAEKIGPHAVQDTQTV
jgi:hypothetical protein